jgi:hypothetical protein
MMKKEFTYTVPEDAIEEIVRDALQRNIEDMDKALERYELIDPGWLAVFDMNHEEDKRKIRKLRKCLRYVLTEWY